MLAYFFWPTLYINSCSTVYHNEITHCVNVLQLNHAIAGKKEPFEHVNIDWGFVLVRH